MKMKQIRLFLSFFALLFMLSINSNAGINLIVGESSPDTVNISGKTYDTLWIKNNSVVYSSSLRIAKAFIIEGNSKLIGYPEYCWFGLSDGSSEVINNSGPDAFENVQMTLYNDESLNVLKGTYPITLDKVFAGWFGRDIKLETQLTIDGPVWNGNDNSIFTNGQTLILTENSVFEDLQSSHNPIVSEMGSLIKIKISANADRMYIPISNYNEKDGKMRTDLIIEVREDAVIGADAQIDFQFIADSFFVDGEGLNAKMINRFMNFSFTNIPNPDFNFYFSTSVFDSTTNDEPLSGYYSAFYNGASWTYGEKVDNFGYFKYHVTEAGTLTAGLNLGLDSDYCYAPTDLYMMAVKDTSTTLYYTGSPSADYYVVNYRLKGQSTWMSDSVAGTSYTISGLDSAKYYEAFVYSVCEYQVDTSLMSDVLDFKTAVPNLSETNDLSIYGNDTIYPFIRYKNIKVYDGGVGIAIDNYTYTGRIDVLTGGTIIMDNFQARTVNGFFVSQAGSTVSFGSTYLVNKADNIKATFQEKNGSVGKGTNLIFTGNVVGAEGQIIDDVLPMEVGTLIFNGSAVLNKKTGGSSILVKNKFEFNSGIYKSKGGAVLAVSTDSVNLNADSVIIQGKFQVISDSCVIKGSSNYVKINELELKNNTVPAKAILEMDLDIGKLSLTSGDVDLNGYNILVEEINTAIDGQIIAETGGTITVNKQDFANFVIPFGEGSDSTYLPVEFNFVEGALDESTTVKFTMMDQVPANISSALTDYLSRYLEIEVANAGAFSYNVSMTYDSLNDVVGNDAFMEAEFFTNGSWVNSYQYVDSVNKKLSLKYVTNNGILSAGNFLEYDSAQAIMLKSKDITTTGASLSWNYLDEGISEWKIYYKETSGAWQSPIIVTDAMNYRLTGLAAGSTYDWYVATDQTGGYTSVRNSDTASFSTTTGCDKPIELAVASIDTNAITVSWTGAANDTVYYAGKNDALWTMAGVSSDDSIVITNLAEQSLYYIKVVSQCGAESDTITANTIVPGWDEENNVLIISDKRNIPVDFVFNKIIIDSAGYGMLTDNIQYVDSLIVNKYGTLDADIYEIQGFVFKMQDTAEIITAHPSTFAKTGEDYSDSGFVQSTVRLFKKNAYYVFDGAVAQEMNKFLETGAGTYTHLTFDNPISVKLPSLKVTFNGVTKINQGTILLGDFQSNLYVGSTGELYNNSYSDAINYGDVELSISGGDPSDEFFAKLYGSSLTNVRVLSQSGYKVCEINSDYVVDTFDISTNSYMRGINLGNGVKITIKPNGVMLDGGLANFVALADSSKIVFEYSASDTALRELPIGFVSQTDGDTKFEVQFKLNSATFGSNPAVEFQIGQTKQPQITSDTYLTPYLSISGSDVSDENYDVEFITPKDKVVGTDSVLYVNVYNGNWINSNNLVDSVVYADTLYSIEGFLFGANSFGDIVISNLKSDSNSINNLLGTELKAITLYPNPAESYFGIVSTEISEAEELEVKIFNTFGACVKNEIIENKTEIVSVSDLEKGVYFVFINSSGQQYVGKLMKE